MKLLTRIPAFDPDGDLNVIIETPKGSHNKYAYDEEFGAFRFKAVMPEGNMFPHDFGFIPPRLGRTATRSTFSCCSTCRSP
jgi:inorganic pyrophosphatase